MISEETHEKWHRAVACLLENGDPYLNEWEAEFLDSISIRLANNLDLTFKQSSILYKLWHRVEEKVG
jgi:hypothetical protein